MSFDVRYSKKTGNEKFLGIVQDISITDYWSWAHSDLLMNIERGKLAEYIVSIAIDIERTIPQSWDNYDLLTPDGIKIEVKSSSYLQSWKQNALSSVSFDIAPKRAWIPETGKYENEIKRQSDVYVFCLLCHDEAQTVNPLDIKQWEFYVINTNILNCKIPKQKRITLSSLISLGAVKSDFNKINNTVSQVLKNADTE